MSGWRDRGNCAPTPPDVAHPRADDWHPDTTDHTTALPLCHGCPVTTQCLAEALRIEARSAFRWGVWGGTTPNQRHKIAEASR